MSEAGDNSIIGYIVKDSDDENSLKKLLDDGVITQEDFERFKK